MKKISINEFISNSAEETLQFGSILAELAEPGDVLCLHGDLGAGKTHLVKGIARGLGASPDKVNSPTFTLINEYSARLRLYHFDTYRLKSLKEAIEIGAEEYFYSDGICVIEWPEILEPILPDSAVHLHITKSGPNTRTIRISGKK